MRDLHFFVFKFISVFYSVQSNNPEGLLNSQRLCYCFSGHCNKFCSFPGLNRVGELIWRMQQAKAIL